MEWLKFFETARIMSYLQALDLQSLVQSPYFLGGAGALAVIALVMRWRVLLALTLTITGFVWLLSYTMTQDTSMAGGGANDTLVVFVFGGAAIVFVAIYLLFIRGE